jgi:hypothetical protein
MVQGSSERRHGTYIHLALATHIGHTLTIRRDIQHFTLVCNDCQESVMEAGANGRWRQSYHVSRCALNISAP